jgi:predicted membrane protein
VLLPVALIAIGLVLVAGSRTGRHGGLITVGAILTVVLLVVTSADIRLEGGVGQQTERPTTVEAISPEYHLSLGQLEIDLRAVAFPDGSNTDVKATVGVGQLVVRIPEVIDYQIHATAGLGDVEVLGRTSSGGDVEVNLHVIGRGIVPVGSPRALVRLFLSVGVGQVTVIR